MANPNPPMRLKDRLILAASKRLNRRTSGLHSALYRLSGGRLGGRVGELGILLLTTTGRKSGEARTTPLNYMPYREGYVVVASNSGRDKPPAWLLNLRANPQATAEVKGKARQVRARVATPEERARIWPAWTRKARNYAEYERMTEREIPVVVLELISESRGEQ